MSRSFRLLGMDPSFSNWGLALAEYTPGGPLSIEELACVSPKAVKQRGVRRNSLDLDRCSMLAQSVLPATRCVDVVLVEVPVGSQSSRAAVSYGVCLGILGALSKHLPVIQLTPAEVKRALTGNAEATKDEMIDAAVLRHPEAPWPRRRVKGELIVIKKSAEHMADAVGAIQAGLAHPELLNYLKSA